MVSINTDFLEPAGDPLLALRLISEVGFEGVHWCHHWCSAKLYSDREIVGIKRELEILDLCLNDLHGSVIPKADWSNIDSESRTRGLDLVRNRMHMCAELGGRSVVLHLGTIFSEKPRDIHLDALRRALETLLPEFEKSGLRLAVENSLKGNWPTLHCIFDEYDDKNLGLCFDSGHHHMTEIGLEDVRKQAHRLFVIHLHDNTGEMDDHMIPGDGTIEWAQLMSIIDNSPHDGALILEIVKKSEFYGNHRTQDFLSGAKKAAGWLETLKTSHTRDLKPQHH